MNTIAWIILLIVAIVIVAAVAWYLGQRRRSERLRERFGPEYERTVESTGKRSDAEAELESRQERVESLEIRPLTADDRDRFRERWRIVQATFVDDPASAVTDADGLIGEVMRARGYPVGDFEQRAADVSVDHPQVVDHYRTAHAIAMRQRTGQADTEQLRQAMVHYRALFADLLDTRDDSKEPADRSDTASRVADRETAATDGETPPTASAAPATDSDAPAATTTSTTQPRVTGEPVTSDERSAR